MSARGRPPRADVLAEIQLGEDADDNIDAEIKRIVDLAPKLSAGQRDTIATLFGAL